MGKIKKAAGLKHGTTLSSAIADFVSTAPQLSLCNLPSYLAKFPRHWPFPRGDLYNWIPLLDHFDSILENFTTEYGLKHGPQTKPFGRIILRRGISADKDGAPSSEGDDETLDRRNYTQDGDRQLVIAILDFTRLLLERCGNRSLYSSSDRLGEILNTTDLSLLSTTLRLAVRLAQRYHASRQRGPNANQQIHNALLISHYNIDLEKVQHLANPFTRNPLGAGHVMPSSASKGKSRTDHLSESPIDMIALATEEEPNAGGKTAKTPSKKKGKSANIPWGEWASVHLRYYKRQKQEEPTEVGTDFPSTHNDAPPTPTQSRRPSGLSKQLQTSEVDNSASTTTTAGPSLLSESKPGGLRSIDLPEHAITSRSVEDILQTYLPEVPKESSYELLTKVRVASAMTTSSATRQELLGIRLLAMTNLAYIYPEQIFQQKIILPDSEEPRRFQLIYQIADLVHVPGNGRARVSRSLQTLGLEALQALAKLKNKGPDVCAALSVNVNHGVLLYLLRRGVASIANEEYTDEEAQEEEWREALFSLVEVLPSAAPRTGESLIAAGIFEPLVEILNLRTTKAERVHSQILGFLNTIIYQVRDSVQTLATAKGFDAIAALIDNEVTTSLRLVDAGSGMPQAYKTRAIDYDIPFYHQQTLRWLFKFINHMMSHGSGHFDRILRNLIDSPGLLNGVRTVIMMPKRFGSTIWSNAVNIVSNFIHNEPTSYAIISEAGLTGAILGCVTSEQISSSPQKFDDPDSMLAKFISGQSYLQGDSLATGLQALESYLNSNLSKSQSELSRKSLAQGILPATETIMAIPQAFGAICLNNAGMDLFLHSSALERFFECFESPDHVRAMSAETDLSRILGTSFDELVRHHPRLRNVVLGSVFVMLRRVIALCESEEFGEQGWSRVMSEKAESSAESAAAPNLSSPSIAAERSRSESIFNPHRSSDISMGEATPMSYDDQAPSNLPASSVPAPGFLKDPDVATYINTALKFLSGLFDNQSLCALFAEIGGFDVIMKIIHCQHLPYDFNNQAASQELAHVIRHLGEQKPYVVMPVLVKNVQKIIDEISPMLEKSKGSSFFFHYVDPHSHLERDDIEQGSDYVKALIRLHTLCNVLFETYVPTPYSSRSNPAIFSSVNLWDEYPKLLGNLMKVHGACVWEEIVLSKAIPETWKNATNIKGYGMGSQEADSIFGFINGSTTSANPVVDSTHPPGQDNDLAASVDNSNATHDVPRRTSQDRFLASPQFKNARIFRYLLSQVPSSIVPLIQNIGKSFTSSRRRLDSYSRQHAVASADTWASAALSELTSSARSESADQGDRFAYWVVMLTSISQLMVEGSFDRSPGTQCVTLLLQAFKNAGGFSMMVSMFNDIFDHVHTPTDYDVNERAVASARAGIRIILGFFAQIVTSKTIVDAKQTQELVAFDRERHNTPFNDAQLLVELRMVVVPAIRRIWESDYLEHATMKTTRCVIDTLKSVLLAAGEHGAYHRGQQAASSRSKSAKLFNVDRTKVEILVTKGFPADLAREALYRCSNASGPAEDYCRLYKCLGLERNSIPLQEETQPNQVTNGQHNAQPPTQGQPPESEPANIADAQTREPHAGLHVDRNEGIPNEQLPSLEELGLPNPLARNLQDLTEVEVTEASNGISPAIEDLLSMSIDQLDSTVLDRSHETPNQAVNSSDSTPPLHRTENSNPGSEQVKQVTIEDLNEERSILRGTIIDRALDVLNVHEDLTFELADLISAAAQKATDAPTLRREIGETLVQSLVSLQTDTDLEPSEGKRIAAYANLLALVIQDNSFYEATLEQIKANYDTLLTFIRVPTNLPTPKGATWVSQILLILEKAFAQDEQPPQVIWRAPSGQDLKIEEPMIVDAPVTVTHEGRCKIFNSIMDILPRIGRDEALALSVVRILIILTRQRNFAINLGEKMNIQRLFVMVKQLAGITNKKLQGSFMILLRNIVEDENIIRDKIKSGILDFFDERSSKSVDTSNYVKSLSGFVLRSPNTFVELTNDLVEISRFDANSHTQILTLKTQTSSGSQPIGGTAVTNTNTQKTAEDTAHEDEEASPKKQKASEVKVPIVEKPSGVIHYLLCELLSYKDVDDKPPSIAAQGSALETRSSITPTADNVYPNAAHVTSQVSAEQITPIKGDKLEFKADQHPIHVYRCFLLQCLTELLMSYNQMKVEFINFSRSADAKATTPSKPRPGVLSYLLKDLIPLGTLSPEETVEFRKKSSICTWAVTTVVALCQSILEPGQMKKVRTLVDDEADHDLIYVRKFVLEICLKSYRDANSSSEELDCKYSRLLHLAELFSAILSGRLSGVRTSSIGTESFNDTQHSIAKIMFEKNYINALTTSIADMDLNFPGSKRAIKYILRPLKQLTQTALALSENNNLSTTPVQVDDDELSVTSSISRAEAEREETPDLFRNSALGMLEPRREDESSSESSQGDQEMYDEDYDDGVEYEEEMEPDEDEVVSDEEDEMEGGGPIEGLPGDAAMDVEVVIDEEEDESTSEDDDDDDDDDEESNDMDMDEDVEVIDEITGDDENASLGEGDEDDWHDGDDGGINDDDSEVEDEYAEDASGDIDPSIEGPASAIQDLMAGFGETINSTGDPEEVGGDEDIENMEDMAGEDEEPEDDDEPDDDEDVEPIETDVVFGEPEFDNDGGETPWLSWNDDAMPIPRRHHHHHPRGFRNPWETIAHTGPSPLYRSNRTAGQSITPDDGLNPLLRRHDQQNTTVRSEGDIMSRIAIRPGTDWRFTAEDGISQDSHSLDSHVSLFENILATIGQSGAGVAPLSGMHGALSYYISGNNGRGSLRSLQALLGTRPQRLDAVRATQGNNNIPQTTFTPASTTIRWQEQSRLLFANDNLNKANRVLNSILKHLIPPAVEKEKIRRAEEAKRLEEAKESEEKQEQERLAKEKADREAEEVKQKAEREAATEAAQQQQQQDMPPPVEAEQQQAQETDEMQGVESTDQDQPPHATDAAEIQPSTAEPAQGGPSRSEERVRATIRGRELDITGMGVDLEYLNALPEDLREEVLMGQLADQRSQAAAAGEEPSDISREFLDALPPEIREELLQQEAQDRRRREQEEARGQSAANNPQSTTRAEEMDPASFLASLDPTLRQAVLAEQDDDVLNQLPASIAAEARALGADRPLHRFGGISGLRRRGEQESREREERRSKALRPSRRQIVQMLDRAGVATLLRLMFIPQHGSSRQSLNDILHAVSQNRQNRAEIVGMLLSILQDGSFDVGAIEKSFTQLSLRAKQAPPSSQKTPQTLKRSLTNQTSPINSSDMTPHMVIQQCLGALVSLTQYNLNIPSFFLTEHDTSSSLKFKGAKKGKSMDTKASRFAINALLSLLDRKLIMESSSCTEMLSSLLNIVTRPLALLHRNVEEAKKQPPGTSTTEPQVDASNAEPQVETSEAGETGSGTIDGTTVNTEPPTEGNEVTQPASTEQGATVSSIESSREQSAPSKLTVQESLRKEKTMTPPEIPEENLRLVVNVLAARECSSKTFRDTLATINNLSAIPQAKETFGKGLVEQAEYLGKVISDDLDDLLEQARKEDSTDADFQALALSKFSPASSDQAKLLRVLSALDYLFDPERSSSLLSEQDGQKPAKSPETTSVGDLSSTDFLKRDFLSTLYEHPTFGCLWVKLSDCLVAIREREGMIGIATILLPLIESLMVVCKSTTMKDASSKTAKEFQISSPPPESGMDSLFFRFTGDHRKVLNELVRNNPKLMSGTFSLLVKNPNVLDFDNKRNYFIRRLHARGSEFRHFQRPLQLNNIRRDQVFLDSFPKLAHRSGDEIKYGKLNIRFQGEEGVDAGGVTREWFQVLARQMFNPDYALFVPVASDRTTFHPNKNSYINEEHLSFFKFIGQIIGKALYEGRPLDCHFSRAVYKRILGRPVSIKDMETLDLDYYKSLVWMLENDITEVITETFSIDSDDFGAKQIVDLVENGRNIPVTEMNKQEYAQLVVEYRLTKSIEAQLEHFLKGQPSSSISLYIITNIFQASTISFQQI